MTSFSVNNPVKLFYSYCHVDERYKAKMEISLDLLRQDGYVHQWSDSAILPGRSISSTIDPNMDDAGVLVFLLSPDFIRSKECRREWEYARSRAVDDPTLFRVPIIVRHCAWKDFLRDDDVLALPKDGVPVSTFSDADEAWLQVYDGIKRVVDELRNAASQNPDVPSWRTT